MSERLQLRAVDADDLSILGAYLQDALVPVSDMCFLSAENRFVLVANRSRWEKLEAPDGDASQGRSSANPAGEPDSGVSGQDVVFDVAEQMVIGGWVRGKDSVTLDVHSSAGLNNLLDHADGLNGLTISTAGSIESFSADSLVIGKLRFYMDGSGSAQSSSC